MYVLCTRANVAPCLPRGQAELDVQKKSNERLKRELSDFKAKAPEADEITEEVLKKIKEDCRLISPGIPGNPYW